MDGFLIQKLWRAWGLYCSISVGQVGSGRKTESQEGSTTSSRSCPSPGPVLTVSGKDVAEHCPELWGGRQLLQDLGQALCGCTEKRRETSEQATLAEELNHRQREELQEDGMKDSPRYHLRRK